jgi:hypothetical protein
MWPYPFSPSLAWNHASEPGVHSGDIVGSFRALDDAASTACCTARRQGRAPLRSIAVPFIPSAISDSCVAHDDSHNSERRYVLPYQLGEKSPVPEFYPLRDVFLGRVPTTVSGRPHERIGPGP